ncbi:uncharacterized protein LOC131515480 [Neofelis nebulosa]|uniref:uncharacterized protein LOC131515480 n=1 Tax=Neofelis nebulosa TaxID=61452 RepID=UPI00272C16F8|nr:uncharacterized protein LOC131515480 [Neofelis nebulosa]
MTATLQAALKYPPINTKSQAVKARAGSIVLKGRTSFKANDIEKAVQSLDKNGVDLLMQYIYKGFQSPRTVAVPCYCNGMERHLLPEEWGPLFECGLQGKTCSPAGSGSLLWVWELLVQRPKQPNATVALGSVVHEQRYRVPALFVLISRSRELKYVPSSLHPLSMASQFLNGLQGPEQEVLLYKNVSLKCQSLFGMSIKLCSNNMTLFGETTPNQKKCENFDEVQTLDSL